MRENINKIKIISLIITCFIGVICGVILSPRSAKADTTSALQRVIQKSALEGVYRCYKQGAYQKSINVADYIDFKSMILLNNKDSSYEDQVPLPNGFYGNKSRQAVSCEGILYGDGEFNGVFELAKSLGQNNPSSIPPVRNDGVAKIDEFLNGMGYFKESGEAGKCTEFVWGVSLSNSVTGETGEGTQSIKLCADVNKNGVITQDQIKVSSTEKGIEGHETLPKKFNIKSVTNELKVFCNNTAPPVLNIDRGGCGNHSFQSGVTKWQDLMDEVYDDLVKNASEASYSEGYDHFKYHIKERENSDQASDRAVYSMDKTATNSAAKAIKYLSNGNYPTYGSLKFTTEDKFVLLQNYLEKFYAIQVKGCVLSGDTKILAENDGAMEARIYYDGKIQMCHVKATKNVDDSVIIYDSTRGHFGYATSHFEGIIGMLNAMKITEISDPDAVVGGDVGSLENGDEEKDGGSSVCSGIGSLAYVICPVAELLGAAVEGMYSWIESNFLEIPASYFTQGKGNAVYDAWKIFQGYANVVFAIVLLVVILSQVTGFGVNNYGIKKMLPKLIVMAVLVNVSFILCQLAIDISNIVGYSLKNMFDGFAIIVGGDDGAFGLGSAALALTSALLAVSTVVVAANTQFWKAWITPFILSLVTVAAGLIVFIVTLGVRQAGVIILVTLSPVALVCYALPNTKRIFDRWKRLFVSMLMVFPICGLLMGGGKLAGTLIAGAGNITEEAVIATVGAITGKHMAAINDASFATSVILDLVAMLVQVVPFFFIPTLVRGSVNGLANIGNLISQKGSKWGNNARNALGKSDAMQSLQRGLDLSRAKGIERGLQRKAGVRSKLGFTNSLSARDSRKLGRIKQRIDQMQSEDAISSIQANVDYDRADRAEAIKASAQSAVMEGLVNEELKRAANDKSLSTDSDYRAALERAMIDAQDDPNDMGKAAKVKALSTILLKRGNTGRGEIGNSFLEILSHSSGKDFEAIKAQADTIMNDQGDVIKKSDARLFKILTKLRGIKSEAEFNTMLTELNIKKGTDADGKVFYETDYDKAGAGDVSAVKLADGDDAILDAYIRAIQRGSVSSGEMAKLTAAAQEALTSPNIHLKAGVRSKIEKIAQGSALQSAALDATLDDVAAHPGDVHAQARANSLALNMSNTAAGREALHSKIIQRAAAGRTAGIKQVADYIYNETHGLTDNYSHATPGMRKMLESIRNDASAGASTTLSDIASRATSVRDATGATHYMDSQFDQHDLLNISASGAASGDLVGVDYADMDSNNLSQIARTITEASRAGYTGELKKNGVDAIANDMANQLRTNEVFRNPAYKSHVEEMNKVLKIAGRSTIDPNNVRMPEPIPAPPPGYSTSGIWIGGGTETKRDKAAFEAWAQEAENIRLRNSKL